MTTVPVPGSLRISTDWELDFYSRPILDAEGKKRWELLICSTPEPGQPEFRWLRICPANSVNSIWLREAIQAALEEAEQRGFAAPRRMRCWRSAMRTMVQRAAEGLGLELVPSRRCYHLVEWLQEREAQVYPQEPGYLVGPLAPPPQLIRPVALPWPETVRGDRWSWAHLPAAALADAFDWEVGFAGLLPLPAVVSQGPEAPAVSVPGIRLFSERRSLAMAGWLAGLEPVRLEICDNQLVLEAGLEDRWLLATLPEGEAEAAQAAFQAAREQAGGLQFIAVQASEDQPRFDGFWMLRDLPDG
jgi:hypothetical protein